MSHYKYRALDPSKSEIRVLRLVRSASAVSEPLRFTLQHVSLDQLLPQYKHSLPHFENAFHNIYPTEPFGPTEAARAWLDADCSTTQSLRDRTWPRIDAWRLSPANEYRKLHEKTTNVCKDSAVPIPPRFEWGDFEAVSYCWESNVRNKKVLVDDQVICVTANLEAMLHGLQDLPEARSGMGFWIDGLCINQADTVEKNHQVALMRRIYSEALSTVVWLGPGDEESNQAVQVFRDLSGKTRDFSIKGFEIDSPKVEPICGRKWRSVLRLWSRNYFKRMWIIQELTMNRNLTLFMCGSERVTRDEIRLSSLWAQEHAGAIAQAVSKEASSHSAAHEVEHDYVWRVAYHVSNLITLEDMPPIDKIFQLARKSDVTDPKDKVYGLLGLLPWHIVADIKPDYAKSVEEVYRELATSLLKTCTRLDQVLSWCSFTQRDLPSWVPDWTSVHERQHIHHLRSFKAGGERDPIWSLQNSGDALQCKAIKVDVIEALSLPTSSSLAYRNVSQSKSTPHSKNFTYGRYGTKPQLSIALARTLTHDIPYLAPKGDVTDLPWIQWDNMADEHPGRHVLELVPGASDQWKLFDRFRQSNASFTMFGPTLQEMFPAISDYSKHIIPRSTETGSVKPFPSFDNSIEEDQIELPLAVGDFEHGYTRNYATNLRRAAVGLHGRRLITTRSGYIGIAPEEVDVGNVVAVLLGCNYPVVLRIVEGGYKYLGECYLHGLMRGEAVEAADRGEYEMEDIVIL